jgi:hypothetical protein
MLLNVQRYSRLLIFFVAAVVVFVVTLMAYDLVYVEKATTRSNLNLQAFPRAQAKDLPDANVSLSKCVDELQTCAVDDDCLSCNDTGTFKCTSVERDGQYEINGIKVPKGSYCLPKTQSAPQCNRYTGKWVWTTSSDCPPDENGVFSSQCWKCMCLYPDLFYDEKDCSTQIACVNTSDKTFQSPEDQRKRNRLKGAPYGKYAGRYWDPSAISSIDDPVLNENPYATDDKGRPLFYCECDARNDRNQKEFTLLPNDPYSCHVDLCYNLGQRLTNTYMCKNAANQPCNPYETPQDCTCSCTCSLNTSATRADGTCQVVAGLCDPGSVNNTYTGCNCTYFQPIQCKSKQANTTRTDLPNCKDQNNPWGQECKDPCAGNPCGSNGQCSRNETAANKYQCSCSYPDMTDAEGQVMDWSTKDNLSTCAGDQFCSYGNTLLFTRAGHTSSIFTKDTPGVYSDKRTAFQCCIPGKFKFEGANSSDNGFARIRCLKRDEASLPISGDVVNTTCFKDFTCNGLTGYNQEPDCPMQLYYFRTSDVCERAQPRHSSSPCTIL